MQTSYTPEILDTLVARVFAIEDKTLGGSGLRYLVRYHGHLVSEDSEKAYTELEALLQPYGITPLFRWDGKRQMVVLIQSLPKPKAASAWVNVLLFALTLISVLMAGTYYAYQGPPAETLPQAFMQIFQNLQLGIPYAAGLLGILLFHEFGHYFAARRNRTHVTLPYFLPLPWPFMSLGTLGAFISMKQLPRNRRVLVDIGVAGPLAGLLVAIPVLALGLWLSPVEELPTQLEPGIGFSLEGNSLLYLGLKYVVKGELLPAPASYGNTPPILYWARFLLTGQPTPLGGRDVMLHPLAWAGWVGLLVTALNLLPAGQLDGGHMIYTLLGAKWGNRLRPIILAILILLGFFWNGWWLWAALIFFLGRIYAEPLDEITPLDNRRKALAILALVIFLFTFTPVPLSLIFGGM